MGMTDLQRAPKQKLIEWLWWGMQNDSHLRKYVDLQATFVEGNRLVFLKNLPEGLTADAIFAAEHANRPVRAGIWTDGRTAALEFSSGVDADAYFINGASADIGGSRVLLIRPGYHSFPHLLGESEQILHIAGAHGIPRRSLEEAFSLYGKITSITNSNVKFLETDAAAAAAENPSILATFRVPTTVLAGFSKPDSVLAGFTIPASAFTGLGTRDYRVLAPACLSGSAPTIGALACIAAAAAAARSPSAGGKDHQPRKSQIWQCSTLGMCNCRCDRESKHLQRARRLLHRLRHPASLYILFICFCLPQLESIHKHTHRGCISFVTAELPQYFSTLIPDTSSRSPAFFHGPLERVNDHASRIFTSKGSHEYSSNRR